VPERSLRGGATYAPDTSEGSLLSYHDNLGLGYPYGEPAAVKHAGVAYLLPGKVAVQWDGGLAARIHGEFPSNNPEHSGPAIKGPAAPHGSMISASQRQSHGWARVGATPRAYRAAKHGRINTGILMDHGEVRQSLRCLDPPRSRDWTSY